MKLLTLNSHSMQERDYYSKCKTFCMAVSEIMPDIIAIQECNQHCDAKLYENAHVGNIPIKSDNHILTLHNILKSCGKEYFYTWLGIKNGYDKYDEGIGFLSKIPIEKTSEITISKTENYFNWKKRMALIMETDKNIFVNVHMGWWHDKDEPMKEQWDKLNEHLKLYTDKNIFVMGDFNSPDNEKNSGYEYIVNSGYYDTFYMAKKRDLGFTVIDKNIAGWNNKENMRIDYVFSKKKIYPKESRVIFNNVNYNVVSDHCGVLLTI